MHDNQRKASLRPLQRKAQRQFAKYETRGYGFVEVCTNLNLETFATIVGEARRLNIKVVGHCAKA